MIRRIERDDGPRYQLYVRRDGKQKYVGTYASEREAEREDARQTLVESGELAEQSKVSRTFTEAADEWIKSLRASKKRSADSYEKRLDLYLKPTLGRLSITRVTTANVMDLRDELAQRFAPATVNGTLICLSSAFTYFRKRQWIKVNPCRDVEPVEDAATSYNWIRTREEMSRLLLACAGDLRDMVAIALGTGLRFDEMLHLQWADVDLNRRLLTIHRGRQGTVKSGKVRHVPILDSVLPVLQARALKRAGAILVFPGEGGKVRSKQGVHAIYKLALRRAQLDVTLRWHDLRHTFASHWMADGGCIFKLSKVLGHHSVKVTEQRYAHLSPTAFEADYGRVAFHVPTEPAKIYELKRDGEGRIVGRGAAIITAA